MSAYETIVMTAKPHANGYAADMRRGYDAAERYPLLTRGWWSRSTHPFAKPDPAPVWPVKTEA